MRHLYVGLRIVYTHRIPLLELSAMLSVTVSPKFQVVIPLAVRERLGIQAGRKLQVLAYDNRVELLPMETPQQLRGFLRGLDTTVTREDDRV